VSAIRALIEDRKINKSKARALFVHYAENGYPMDPAWQMLGTLATARQGKPKVTVGSKVERKLHAGKTGRKGLYIPMGPYAESEAVIVSYSKNQVTIRGIEPDGVEA
jgi:hypothetical protein